MTQTQAPQAEPQASLKQYCRQEAETASLAKHCALSTAQWIETNPTGHLNIALIGDLGAGKTSFARHFIQGLGYPGKVKSPTYTLCEPYEIHCNPNAFTVHHFDLYRMRNPLEWQEAGFAEYFDMPGLCLIEWPEKAEGTLPNIDLQIELSAGEHEHARAIQMSARSEEGKRLLEKISVGLT